VSSPYLANSVIDAEAERLRFEALQSRAADVPADLDAIVYDYLCDKDALIIDDETDLPDEDGEEVLGKTMVRAGRILINRRLKQSGDTGRYRFTVAHGLGHWRLHRPRILAADDQTGLFPAPVGGDVITTLNRSIGGPKPLRHEIQANRFAATLLIDHKALRREFTDRFDGAALSHLLNTARSRGPREQGRLLAAHSSSQSPSLATLFAVSIEAMAIALESRGYLVENPTLFPT
jgi:Zn-dependent peptidase ImmA (M78 family)